MIKSIRGIECSLYNGRVEDLLVFLSNKPFDFYIRWCMKVDDNHMTLPKSSNNFRILPQDLRKLAKESIWELVLYVYPSDSYCQRIETYDDFINSMCICCLIFYDCGLLDIYVKESKLRDELYDLLLFLQAKDLAFITDDSDGRTRLCL